jgi:hypothetical protein
MNDTLVEIKDYYSKWIEERVPLVLKELVGHRNQIAKAQKHYTWYLYLDWRNISEEEFIALSIVFNHMMNYPPEELEKDNLLQSVWRELIEQFQLSASRFKQSRKAKIWSSIVLGGNWTSTHYLFWSGGRFFLPITEWEGNYKNVMNNFLRRHFSLRYNTPRRLKKQERVRGYRDHGSMPTKSQVARRNANRDQTTGVTQEGYIVNIQEFTRSRQRKLPEDDPDL